MQRWMPITPMSREKVRMDKQQPFDYFGAADVLVGSLALVLAIALGLLEFRKSGISFAVISNLGLDLHGSQFQLSVNYGDVALGHPRILILRLANSGNKTVAKSDFETPIGLNLGECKIIALDIPFSSPSDLNPTINQVSEGVIQIEPLLLNKRDLVEIQILIDGAPSKVEALGRIHGVKRIEQQTVPRDSWNRPWKISVWSLTVIGFTMIALVAMGVWAMTTPTIDSWSGTILGAMFFLFAIGFYPLSQLHRLRASFLFLDPR
jgi:hypothetical protein